MLRAALILAFLVLSSLSLAQEPAVTEARKAELTAMYAKARSLQDESRYADALPLFQQVARELDSPNALLEAGRCLHKMGRNVEAYETMQATEKLAERRAQTEPRYAPVIEAAREELAAIAKEVGRLTVTVAPSGALEVNGQSRMPGEVVVVAPGTVRIDVHADGHTPVRQDVDVAAGSHKELLVQLVPLPSPAPAIPPPTVAPVTPVQPRTVERGGGVRIAGYVVLGFGVLGWVGLIAGGVVSDDHFADIQSRCGDGPCRTAEDQEIIDQGRDYEILANIGLAFGIAGTVAGTLMIIFGGPTEEPAPFAFAAHPGGGFLAYTGSF